MYYTDHLPFLDFQGKVSWLAQSAARSLIKLRHRSQEQADFSTWGGRRERVEVVAKRTRWEERKRREEKQLLVGGRGQKFEKRFLEALLCEVSWHSSLDSASREAQRRLALFSRHFWIEFIFLLGLSPHFTGLPSAFHDSSSHLKVLEHLTSFSWDTEENRVTVITSIYQAVC